MITHRLALALIDLAAQRWPEHIRADVRREWTAEVGVLATQHRRLAMLRYATSLATHPAPRPATPVLPRIRYAVAVLLAGPVLCFTLFVGSLVAVTGILSVAEAYVADMHAADASGGSGGGLADYIAVPLTWLIETPLLSAACLAAAFLAGRVGRQWGPDLPGVLPRMLMATVPGFAAVIAVFALINADNDQYLPVLVVALYTLGFGVVLYGAARLARSGRRRAAWWLGIAGAVAMADLAIMPAVFAIQLTPADGTIAGAYAPLWLPALLSSSGLGLPHPTPMEVLHIHDLLVGVPQLLIVVTGWALGAVLRKGTAHKTAGRAKTQPT